MADTHLSTPLLIYIDDHWQGGDAAKLIAFAQHLNVKVRAFKTTQEFEVWLAHNMGTFINPSHSFKFLSRDVLMFLDFLTKHNTGAPRNIRVITDAIHPAYRTDVDIDAGRRVARYFRDRVSNIPILVKTPVST